jgi:uncharacterized membrane protein
MSFHAPRFTPYATPMSASEALLIAIRWAHALATVVWLGGGAYATLILGKHLRDEDEATATRIGRATGVEFGRWLRGATVVFVASGAILTFDRLASRGATTAYGITLAVKIALALWMFAIAQSIGRRRRTRPATGRGAEIAQLLGSPQLLLWLGAIVVLLAAILKTLYEAQLAR